MSGPNYDDGRIYLKGGDEPPEHAPKSLRDEFAMAASPESLRTITQFVMAEPGFRPGTRGLSEVVQRGSVLAFATADAMMEARK